MRTVDEDAELAAGEALEEEKARDARARDVHQETGAMHSAFCILQPLDFNARRRALRWIAAALDNAEVPF